MSDELDEKLESQKTDENIEEKPEAKKPEVKTSKEDVDAFKKALRDELAASIRQEEKAKLYESFEKYKGDAKTAEEQRAEMEKKLKEYEQKNLSADEQTALRLQELELANTKHKEDMDELVKLANDKITALQLELAKKELLAQYNDEIIPSMVSGSTLEELMENAEKAHREYIGIRDKELAKAKEAVKPKDQIGSGIGPSSERLNVSPSLADIKNINDPKELEKLKEKLFSGTLRN